MSNQNFQEEMDRHWHLDRRVPLAVIITILIQTAGFVWWAASLTTRVDSLERTREVAAPQADRLTRVEVKLEVLQSGVEEIKRLIQQRPITTR